MLMASLFSMSVTPSNYFEWVAIIQKRVSRAGIRAFWWLIRNARYWHFTMCPSHLPQMPQWASMPRALSLPFSIYSLPPMSHESQSDTGCLHPFGEVWAQKHSLGLRKARCCWDSESLETTIHIASSHLLMLTALYCRYFKPVVLCTY